MITFSKLGKKGNLGNQLFQIAATIGIAKKNNHDFCFLEWKFADYFENKLPNNKHENFEHFKENQFHFDEIFLNTNKNYDLEGWFQSEKYFDIDSVKHFFAFKKVEVSKIKKIYEVFFQKQTILISIRRGDFVDHLDYFQLPINYYINALIDNFANWQDCNILVLSDDIKYCKFHFSCLDNVFFGNEFSGIEQLILGHLCDHFIISNSTFSWWCTWLGEKKHSKIIRPLKNFTDQKNLISNDKDFFPERWILYNHLDKKIDLKNTIIKIKSANNLLLEYYKSNFDFNNKTEILNFDIKFNENCDVLVIENAIIPPMSIYFSTIESQEKKLNISYIQIGKTLNVSNYLDAKTLIRQFDFGIFARLLNQNNKKNPKKILFILFNKNLSNNFIDFNIINNIDFIQKNSFAGRIKTNLECRYFVITNFESLTNLTKRIIKNLINFK